MCLAHRYPLVCFNRRLQPGCHRDRSLLIRIGIGFALALLANAESVAAQNVFEVVTAFRCCKGPATSLLEASDGRFYGTTVQSGAHSNGTIFAMDAAGNITTLHEFSGLEGAFPEAALIQPTDGLLYGTTAAGGTANQGTVYRITPEGVLTTLHSFAGPDGARPTAALFEASDGYLYGTTQYGGKFNFGTVFRIDSAGNLTTVHSFTRSDGDGAYPTSSLIESSDGELYGTTSLGGTRHFGAIYKIDGGGNVTTLYSFWNIDGSQVYAPLIKGPDGRFYGTTAAGGTNNKGTILRLTAAER